MSETAQCRTVRQRINAIPTATVPTYSLPVYETLTVTVTLVHEGT